MARRRVAGSPDHCEQSSLIAYQDAYSRVKGLYQLGWTATDLAGRLGVNVQLVGRIERGAPGTAVGTVLEAAVLCGVPLFGVDPADPVDLADLADLRQSQLALLPARVRPKIVELDDDF